MTQQTRRLGVWYWVVREWLVGEPELHVLPLFLDRGGVFVDAGANSGVYSLTACRFSDQVVAYEPNPDLATGLRIVLRNNDVVREVAISDRASIKMFEVPRRDAVEQHTRGSLAADSGRSTPSDSSENRRFQVRTCALDDEELGAVQLIKIDVEGHENAVLRGSAQLIEDRRPVVMVEAEERHTAGAIAEMGSFFESKRYSGWFIYRGNVVPFDRFDFNTHQIAELGPQYGTRTDPDYVNNFIWVPSERPDLVGALRRNMSGGRMRSLASLIRGAKRLR